MSIRMASAASLIGISIFLTASQLLGQIQFNGTVGAESPSRSLVGLHQPSSILASEEIEGEVIEGEAIVDVCTDCGSEVCECGAVLHDVHQQKRRLVEAWLAQGYTYNDEDPPSGLNTPLTFNDFSREYQMNQLYVSLGQDAESGLCCWDIGGRVDLLYGTDYFFTMASGLETRVDGSPKWNSADGPRNGGNAARYGLAMPQLYAELFAPIGPGVTFKVGHFYTTLGYETVTSPDNFFYSHAYTMQYGEPFTHTGVLAEWDVSCCLSAHAGYTNGWDNWEDPNDTGAFLGGVDWTSWDERTNLAFAIHTGKEDANGNNTRTTYSIVLTRYISPCVTYVLQHDLGVEENAAIASGGGLENANWYGINQYLLVALNNKHSVGLRVEWFRDEENARVLGIPIESNVQGSNYAGLTLGWNYKPLPYMTWRKELRWDWSDVVPSGLGGNGMYNDFTSRDQFTAAIDAIVRF